MDSRWGLGKLFQTSWLSLQLLCLPFHMFLGPFLLSWCLIVFNESFCASLVLICQKYGILMIWLSDRVLMWVWSIDYQEVIKVSWNQWITILLTICFDQKSALILLKIEEHLWMSWLTLVSLMKDHASLFLIMLSIFVIAQVHPLVLHSKASLHFQSQNANLKSSRFY